MSLDVARLRCFSEVATRGTVAAAAESLGYSGPAVSQQISKLEAELGTNLFDRVGGRLRLSNEGRAFQPHALAVLASIEQARRSVNDPAQQMSPLQIIGFPSAVAFLLAPALKGWFSDATKTEVMVREADDATSLRELVLGHADVAFVQEYSHVPVQRNEQLHYVHIMSDPVALVVSANRSGPIGSLAELNDERWIIIGPKTPCATATLRACTDAGFTPRIVAETTDNAAALALIAAGVGVALIPRLVLTNAVGVVEAEIQTGITRDIYAAVRPTGPTHQTDQVMAELRSVSLN